MGPSTSRNADAIKIKNLASSNQIIMNDPLSQMTSRGELLQKMNDELFRSCNRSASNKGPMMLSSSTN